MSKFLVCGAGGFIGGHLAADLKNNGHDVFCADIKPLDQWFQLNDKCINFSSDLKDPHECEKLIKENNIEYIYNMACNMGGMGFIENNKAECMISVLINTNLLRSSVKFDVKKYFFSSSACVYNAQKQNKTFIPGLKEEDSYPADPEDGYGWEKLFSERMCRHFYEDFGLETRIARFHNVYGPLGTYDGGREKAPAAICRKIAFAKKNKLDEIEIWGDGEQTRSFMFIEDCIEGTKKIFQSNYRGVLNLGSSEQVSINMMVDIVSKISGKNVKKKYLLDKPKGVRGRSSDNSKILKELNWEPGIKLEEGLKKTYRWIEDLVMKNPNVNNFIKF